MAELHICTRKRALTTLLSQPSCNAFYPSPFHFLELEQKSLLLSLMSALSLELLIWHVIHEVLQFYLEKGVKKLANSWPL